MSFFAHKSAVIDEGSQIGEGTKIWHFSHVMKNSIIGTNCSLGQNVMIASGVVLGNNVKVQNNVSLYTGVTCEDDVFFGPSCVFTNVINPRSAFPRRDQFKTTVIRKGATIGANSTIVCGNNIGQYAFVGAGAVVTKDIPDHALVIGTPARQVAWVSRAGHKLDFSIDNIATCPETEERYELTDGNVSVLK